MAGFLYYLPDRTGPGVTRAMLDGLGLSHAFERQPAVRGVVTGPAEKPGVILVDDQRVERIGYHREAQHWEPVPGSEAWIGYYLDAKPGPADLARGKQLDGASVELGDGNQWLIPIARSAATADDGIAWHVNVPRGMALGADGKWAMGSVLERYRGLWDLCVGYLEVRIGSSEGTRKQIGGREVVEVDFNQFPDLATAATAVLGHNYVVGPAEASALGLWTTDTITAVMDAASDWTTVADWFKKKLATMQDQAEPAGGNSADGQQDSLPDTDRL